MCKDYYPNLPSNENGFTQEDLNQITCLFTSKDNNSNSYFEKITSLDELKYFNNLKEIKPFCFYHCTKLKSVIFPKNLQNISSNGFYYCRSLEKVVFPANIQSIESNSFSDCFSLKKLKFPDSIKEIYR